MIFFSCWATYIQIFFGKIHNIVTTTVTNSTNVEPVSYIYIIKPTGCQNNPGRVFPLDASASIPVLVPYAIRYHTTIRQEAVITIQCVTLWTVDSILCMYDFMLWLHFYFMPCFYLCIPCFYHVCILWNMLCQKWRNKQATTTSHLCGEFTGPGEFPAQRAVTRSFDVFFDLRLNKRLSKQPSGWWFETPLWSLWRHRNGKKYIYKILEM